MSERTVCVVFLGNLEKRTELRGIHDLVPFPLQAHHPV